MPNDQIFVSIASYRDPQLTPTVADCIRKASQPDRLRFGICNQRDPQQDPPLDTAHDSRFRVLDIHWRESKGACWARAEVMELWSGEDWFLQIDSHCRFADGWDASLLRMARETESAKPILSTYATPFNPEDGPILRGEPLQMLFQSFTPEGILQLRPDSFPASRNSRRPFRARFLAAGFLFAPGRFVEDVPYDPGLYFMGEESAMTVRAFSHGYDLFHPVETILWHDYIRADAKKHWGDHADSANVSTHWIERDNRSRDKVRRLLSGAPVESFGLGTERSLEQYEAYAGLSFRHRKAQRYTILGLEPPNPQAPPDWIARIHPWIAKLKFDRHQIPNGALEDPQLWNLSIQDASGSQIFNRDVTAEELAPFAAASAGPLVLVCEFQSETIPAGWTLWPLSRSAGWLSKFGGAFAENDFAILEQEEDGEVSNAPQP